MPEFSEKQFKLPEMQEETDHIDATDAWAEDLQDESTKQMHVNNTLAHLLYVCHKFEQVAGKDGEPVASPEELERTLTQVADILHGTYGKENRADAASHIFRIANIYLDHFKAAQNPAEKESVRNALTHLLEFTKAHVGEYGDTIAGDTALSVESSNWHEFETQYQLQRLILKLTQDDYLKDLDPERSPDLPLVELSFDTLNVIRQELLKGLEDAERSLNTLHELSYGERGWRPTALADEHFRILRKSARLIKLIACFGNKDDSYKRSMSHAAHMYRLDGRITQLYANKNAYQEMNQEVERMVDSLIGGFEFDQDKLDAYDSPLEESRDRIVHHKIARSFVEHILSEYQLDTKQVLDEWTALNKTSAIASGVEHIKDNVHTMHAIHEHNPKAVSTLHDRFGITFFGRYPVDMLLAQSAFAEKNTEQPYGRQYGVIVSAKYDHNGALYNKAERIWPNLFEKFNENGYGLYVVEAGNKRELARRLLTVKKLAGVEASFGIGNAHGWIDGIALGRLGLHGNTQKEVEISINDIRSGAGMQRVLGKSVPEKESIFGTHAPIVLTSCSTGANEGFVQSMSTHRQGITTGPNKDTHLEKMEPIFDEHGTIISFDVKYAEENIAEHYEGGKSRMTPE